MKKGLSERVSHLRFEGTEDEMGGGMVVKGSGVMVEIGVGLLKV